MEIITINFSELTNSKFKKKCVLWLLGFFVGIEGQSDFSRCSAKMQMYLQKE